MVFLNLMIKNVLDLVLNVLQRFGYLIEAESKKLKSLSTSYQMHICNVHLPVGCHRTDVHLFVTGHHDWICHFCHHFPQLVPDLLIVIYILSVSVLLEYLHFHLQ